jgi:hypothetical protein
MSVSNYTESAWLSRLKNIGTTAATTHYYSLHTADPTDTGANEVTSTYLNGRASYAATDYFIAPDSNNFRVSQNSVSISFGNTIAASPVDGISHYGCWDAATGGNLLYSGIFQGAGDIAKPLQFPNDNLLEISAESLSRLVPTFPLAVYEADNILGFLTGIDLLPLANLYAGLDTSLFPSSSSEVTVAIRGTRLTVPPTFWGAITASGESQQIASVNNLDFGRSLNAVSEIIALTFWNALSGGDLIGYGLRDPIDIAAGDPVLVPAGSIIWRIN